jgi:hypothetical protein
MFVAVVHPTLPKESPFYRVMADLDHDRWTVGLDNVLSKEQIVWLERCARRWERIENSLSSSFWQGQVGLADRIEVATVECMLRLVAYMTGGPGSPADAQGWVGRLNVISKAMDAAMAALDSYYRPTEEPAGVPAKLPQVAALESLL